TGDDHDAGAVPVAVQTRSALPDSRPRAAPRRSAEEGRRELRRRAPLLDGRRHDPNVPESSESRDARRDPLAWPPAKPERDPLEDLPPSPLGPDRHLEAVT